MTLHSNLVGFVVIVSSICPSRLTSCFGMGGKVGIRDAEHAIRKMRSCFISSESIILTPKTANVNIVCNQRTAVYTWIIAMTHTRIQGLGVSPMQFDAASPLGKT